MTQIIILHLLTLFPHHCILMPEGVAIMYENGGGAIFENVTCDELEIYLEDLV